MVEVISRSNDDPPIFALRVSGRRPAEELQGWLSDTHEDVRRVEVHVEQGTELRDNEIRRLSAEHGVSIEVIGEGREEAATTIST